MTIIYQPKEENRYKGILSLVLFIVILVGSIYRWQTRIGCFSHSNFERISIGMKLSEVQALLGSGGKVETEQYLPSLTGYVKGAPPDWNKVVWGDTYRKWEENGNYILIGLKGDVVISKWYWELSL